MPRECAAVGCAELQTKGSLFSFRTFPKDSSRRKLHSWRFELEIFQVGYPVDTHKDMNFLLRVSVTHRPAFARLILGRWKERSLRMKLPSLPILQGIYPDSEIHFDTLAPSAKIKIKKGEKPPSQETLQKMKGKSTKEKNVHTNPQQEWTRNKCRRRKRRRREKKKRKQKTNGHGKHGGKKGKIGGTTLELPTNTPALSKKQNKREAKNQSKNNREKSKSRKVNRNSAGLCTF